MKVSQLIKLLIDLQPDAEVFFMSCCECDIGMQSPTTDITMVELDDHQNAVLIELEA